ncbi:MAG: sialate O-acetylesterase [Paraclostridium sp.]
MSFDKKEWKSNDLIEASELNRMEEGIEFSYNAIQSGGIQGPQGPRGDKGDKGDQGLPGEPGVGINMTGKVQTRDEILAITNAKEGDAWYCFEDGKLYVANINNPSTWNDWMDLYIKGEKGDKGEKGEDGKDGAGTEKEYNKFVIVCVAGQSNAVGYDESSLDTAFSYKCLDSDRIKQLSMKDETNLELVPLGHCAHNYQMMDTINARGGTAISPDSIVGMKGVQNVDTKYYGTKGVHLPLANLLLNEIPDDYGVLIIPVAHGGTGFIGADYGSYDSSKMRPTLLNKGYTWGVQSSYYKGMVDRIKYALNLNPENIFAGVVWIQGENDKNNAATHWTGFSAMVNDFFAQMNASHKSRVKKGIWDKDIWFNVETVSYWYSQGQCQTIWNNYKSWSEKTYVEIPRSTPCNLTLQTSGTAAAHFGLNAYATTVAPRIVEKMKAADCLFKSTVPKEFTTVVNGQNFTSGDWNTARVGNLELIPASANGVVSLDSAFCMNLAVDPDYVNGVGGVYFSQDTKKMKFRVTRSFYWVIFNGNRNDTAYVVGIGISSVHRKISSAAAPNQVVANLGVANEDVNSSLTMALGDTILYAKTDDGRHEVYLQKAGTTDFKLWFAFRPSNYSSLNLKDEQLGFAVGISVNEAVDKKVLCQDLLLAR